ncbi:MAG TPA: hypothetical protein VF411_11070, partial [Bacteroidia bacterium]
KEGRNNMKDGISFNELIKHLGSKGFQFNAHYLDYFHIWFYTNFYHPSVTPHLKSYTFATTEVLRKNQERDNDTCIITGEAYENLIDFENLQEARKSSKQANKLATWAIVISIVLALIQIIIALC